MSGSRTSGSKTRSGITWKIIRKKSNLTISGLARRRRSHEKRLLLNVQKEFCDECSLALRRFIGKMDGVNSIDTESGKIVIDFDDSRLTEEHILKISRESIEKLGYKLDD